MVRKGEVSFFPDRPTGENCRLSKDNLQGHCHHLSNSDYGGNIITIS